MKQPTFVLPLLLVCTSVIAATGDQVQERIDGEIEAGKPLVAHVVVALCDNRYQGIVPVKAELGNGDDPARNLYWGALYGVKTHLKRKEGWKRVEASAAAEDAILERVVYKRKVKRNGKQVDLYLVADAWRGKEIKKTVAAFLEMAAGRREETVMVLEGEDAVELPAGGSAPLIAYVGHNGLMDFRLPHPKAQAEGAKPRSAVILACRSGPFFEDHLDAAGAHPLLGTTGFMAPEAYTLHAAVMEWFGGGKPEAVREAAASAYHAYQKCGMNGARRLFAVN